jgi:predicted Zn-dependent protease
MTGRRRLMLLSRAQERALGEATFRQMLRQAGARNRLLPTGHAASRRLQGVAKRVVRAASDLLGEAGHSGALDGVKWSFAVVDEPSTVNAFALPSGAVVVYTGLLQRFPGDAELATIVAHEVAHVTCRHAAEKISYHSCISLVISLAAGMLNVGPGLAHTFSQLALELPFSRECELEADAVGLRIMSRACFEPSAAPRAMARLDQLAHGGGSGGGGGGGVAGAVSSYLSTHPPSQARVKALHDGQTGALELYEGAGCSQRRQGWRMSMKGAEDFET